MTYRLAPCSLPFMPASRDCRPERLVKAWPIKNEFTCEAHHGLHTAYNLQYSGRRDDLLSPGNAGGHNCTRFPNRSSLSDSPHSGSSLFWQCFCRPHHRDHRICCIRWSCRCGCLQGDGQRLGGHTRPPAPVRVPLYEGQPLRPFSFCWMLSSLGISMNAT